MENIKEIFSQIYYTSQNIAYNSKWLYNKFTNSSQQEYELQSRNLISRSLFQNNTCKKK
jgi:hypothetical protein